MRAVIEKISTAPIAPTESKSIRFGAVSSECFLRSVVRRCLLRLSGPATKVTYQRPKRRGMLTLRLMG